MVWCGGVWGGKEANGSLSQVCTGLTRLCDVCVLFISVLRVCDCVCVCACVCMYVCVCVCVCVCMCVCVSCSCVNDCTIYDESTIPTIV